MDSKQDGSGMRTAMHPIGVVAKRTGISLHVLRAWERRYGVVEPVRTPGGQRLYSDADIQRLRLLREATEAGRNISQVAELTDEELVVLAAQDVVTGTRPLTDTAAWFRETCIAAGERLNGEVVHSTLMRAVVSLRPREFMGEVLLPLLHEVGTRWHAGQLGPAQEHVVSEAARRVLLWLLDAYEPGPESPVLLATTPAGEQHEFGAMAVSAAALEEGWRVVYLGASLPASEIARAALQVRARVVALSMVTVSDRGDTAGEVVEVMQRVTPAARVVAGGAGAQHVRGALESAGVQVVTDLDALRDVLRFQSRAGGVA
jgi:DNA-binding transcriptional MerR regulator/methylmalonyl-CoA mutase cobalamin-binding subunit